MESEGTKKFPDTCPTELLQKWVLDQQHICYPSVYMYNQNQYLNIMQNPHFPPAITCGKTYYNEKSQEKAPGTLCTPKHTGKQQCIPE